MTADFRDVARLLVPVVLSVTWVAVNDRQPTSGFGPRVDISLPDAVVRIAIEAIEGRQVFLSDVDKMRFVLSLTELNIADGGGPFGAAIFDEEHRLVAPGVNRVVADSAPIAHAEIVAIAAAGQAAGSWDLASTGKLTLVTSTEPCAMCLGAVPWSGVSAVVIGCRDADARQAGFDEGHKPTDWIEHLQSIGIAVERDVERAAAAEILSNYSAGGGAIYNGGTV